MDSLITAAARALAAGDPLGALTRVALRNDPPALALRGTAMAQLGDFSRARVLLRTAARAYGAREALSCARCTVAEAEVALAARDLTWSPTALDTARKTLEAHGDHANAVHVRHLEVRRLLLMGRLDDAEIHLDRLDLDASTPALRTTHELAIAEIAVRRVQAEKARAALDRAARAARDSGVAALTAEVDAAALALTTTAARLMTRGGERALRLEHVEALFASKTLVVDACRFRIQQSGISIELTRRPVLFMLARLLAEAWPEDAARSALISRLFRVRRVDDSFRARLRVEVGRLRRVLRPLADILATPGGFCLAPRHAGEVAVLARTVDDEHAVVLALLADGEAWSSASLALVLNVSPRTAQRALESLAARGKAHAFGRGRARRWTTPASPGFATALLLTAPLPVA